METYLDLTKGLHTDFEPVNQPQSTYRYLKDAIREISGAIENERGTVLTATLPAEDRRVIGSYVLDDDVVFFSYSPSLNLSEIGLLNNAGVYTILTNDTSLGFSLDVIIRAEGKKNFKGESILYFVGKGLPMRVLNLSNIPTVNFNDNTKLVLTADMPQVSLGAVIEGGTLPTGIYQFGVRLLTKSTNSTSLSLLTNPIPVIDEDGLDRDRADGAPPQTESNKAISLSISNIDTDYEFIEVIAITFIGSANIAQANVVGRLPIQGRTTIDFIYTSLSQIKEAVDINSLVVEPINYESAEFISQKDGVLELASLTSSNVDYNFQSAANLVTAKYEIKEVVWNENIQISNGVDVGTTYPVGDDYKNANTSTSFKSYMRDEVYSFAIVPIFTNWAMGSAYHIPAIARLLTTAANTVTKELGSYISNEDYPSGRNYPTGGITNKVRHHKMPSLIQEPHVQTRNGQTFIRLLGVSFDLTKFMSTIPENVKKQVIGYIIVKQKRDDENKSILSQGIATGHVSVKDSNYSPIPFSGKWPTYNNVPNSTLPSFTTSGVVDQSIVAFYSPESIITKNNLKTATNIKPVLEIAGVDFVVKDKRAGDNKYAYMLLNYDNSTTDTSILNSVRNLDTSLTQYVTAGPEKEQADIKTDLPTQPLIGLGKSIATWKNPGYALFKISNGDLPIRSTLSNNGKGEIYYEFKDNSTDDLHLNNFKANTGNTTRHLYNITRNIDRQYGTIFDAKYHYVNHLILGNTTSPIITCFNGDTFITKFSVLSSMNPGIGSNTDKIVDLKTLSYFWVESSINCGFRHFKQAIGKEGDSNYEQGTLPYYPKVKVLATDSTTSLGLFNYSTSLGHPTGYNKQYSFENTIRSYYSIPLELELVSTFTNRIIYSEQSVEGEQQDAFRVFLNNNYHDIPKEKGKITNLFILANKLFVHTERSLWRTYFNEQVTQASSAGEVYLGNGGIFNRPSTEVMSVKGGYAGTQSSSGCTTPFGHFFIDEIQKKAFMFSEELKEISDQGMFKYFKNNVNRLANTPALGVGYSSVYDYQNKRWLLTKIGQWTLSYSTQLNSWSSFHSYMPYHYVSVGDRLYSLDENTINEMNVGIHGVFYGGLPQDLKLDIVINDSTKDTKTLDNLIFYTTSQNADAIEQHHDTFSTLQAYNTTKNTGKCRLVVPKSFEDEFIPLSLFEAFCKLKSNEFRVAIPSDLVVDVTKSIFDVNNLDTSRAYRPRMSGKYFVVSLSYNNLRDNRFILHNIGRLFRQRIR